MYVIWLQQKKLRKFHCFAPPPWLFLPLGDRKTKSFFCTRHQEKERAGVSTAAATLHYGLKLVGGVVRKIGNCFGGASPSEAAETVAAALRLLHFFLVERGRKDNTRLIGTLRA